MPIARFTSLVAALVLAAGLAIAAADQPKPGRDSRQPIDEEYTRKIREYTTEPFFLSPLVDYLPASRTVPTPKAALGDVAGAPGILPYAAEVHSYMRQLENASRRVKVFSIGFSEEGREMIAVAIASESLLARIEANRSRLARLADPRRIGLSDAEAEPLIDASTPVYYITGAIHSPETGAPTALMELAYRLAVDESPYIRAIRNGVITLITPVVEVDGRDRMVDLYKWRRAHPGRLHAPLLYWGKYVAHDNNRDAMAVTLKLTRNVLETFLSWKAQVLHDLHESVPYLYDNTIGDGPYNAWIDPILADEWQLLGWNNVSEMTKFGMPGVFTHGNFDTWSPGYLMFLAAMHNGISRLYETFGNGGPDTLQRTLRPSEYSRTWYRQNPPLPTVRWSARNNNNYQQTALLTALSYFSANRTLFLRNFYLKSKRSILKATTEGPAAWVLPADDPRSGPQAALLRILQTQGVEVSRAAAPFTVSLPPRTPERRPPATTEAGAAGHGRAEEQPAPRAGGSRTFPAGSYVIRMDQPYSRIADALLDRQYWSPTDPQKRPYDDTAWTFPELMNVRAARVTDVKVLDAAMAPVVGPVTAAGGIRGMSSARAVQGTGVFAIAHHADPALATFRYRIAQGTIDVAEEPFEAGGRTFGRGSFIVQGVAASELDGLARDLGLEVQALAAPPTVKTHPARAPRVALVHTWLSTQNEGWWRLALDTLGIPFQYISTQAVARTPDLRARYEVILFPPVGRASAQIVSGLPMWGPAIPWKSTADTPNLGTHDQTDDIRPGLGFAGLEHLQAFVRAGGVLIGVMDTAELLVGHGLAPGVTIARREKLKIVGSTLKTLTVDATSPLAYGYGDALSIYADASPIFNVSHFAGAPARRTTEDEGGRPTGRGAPDDQDVPQGRPFVEAPSPVESEPWRPAPVTDEQQRNNPNLIPPRFRPRVVLRYADAPELLVSGLLEAGSELAQHPAVIDVPVEQGHLVLFSNNPVWRGETHGSYFLVLNALINFDSLDAGRKLDDR